MTEQRIEMPEGPVTIMFTDVEGSTALRTSLGDAEADGLFDEHGKLLRTVIAEHRGQDQKAALGDGFLAVFVSTRRAIACAIEIQRVLDAFNRSRSMPLRVRIGLNTGEVAVKDEQLSGEAIHAASRVCAAASGGQILVSDVTRQLGGTIPDVSFNDTGEHELKGFPQPWRLWEVIWVRETTKVTEQVFVGRESELAILRQKLTSTLDGRGGLVLVGGEPGVGKTTLVKQLIHEAEQRGALAVFGRCYESEGSIPYSPFVEMLEQGLALIPPEMVREDMGEDAGEVARMVPELRRRFPDIPEPLELPPEQQRRYFFNAVSSFISRGAARFPLMLVMDDVHWADESTLLLIEHMAALMPEMRVLGVATYRDVELDVSRPLAATIERLLRARLIDRIPVKRFDRDGVATMVAAMAGKTAPDAIVDAIFSETEGNPFFVEEVFRHLNEEHKLFDETGDFRSDIQVDELDVPESVRLVVGRRLERLGEQAQKVLAAGAVVGRAFPFSLLEEISDVDSGALLDIVEEAETARVIVPEERDGAVHFFFAHELIRQTLLASLSMLRRQRLHLTVANALERLDPDGRVQRPSEIANHLVQAGAAAETERTLEYLERTFDRAKEAAAFEEALKAIDDALTVVDEADALHHAKLLERKGWAVRALGRFEECIEIWDQVAISYTALGELEAAGRLYWEMGYQLLWLVRFADAYAKYAEGLEAVGSTRSSVRAELMGAAAALTGLAGLFDPAESGFTEALEIAEESGDEGALGRIQWGHCVSYWSHARGEQSIVAGRSSVEHLRRSGDLWTLVDSLSWLSYAYASGGALDEALAVAREGVELGAKVGHQAGEVLAARGVYFAESMAGRSLDECYQRGELDLSGLRGISSPWVSQSHVWLCAIDTLRGNLDDALEQAEAAIGLEPESAWSGLGVGWKLLNRAYAGDADACRAIFDEHLPALPRDPGSLTSGSRILLSCACEGMSILGWKEELTQLYPVLSATCESSPTRPFDGGNTERVAGMAATVLGLWDEAEHHFESALRQAEGWPNVFDDPVIRHRYAEMLIRRGRPEDSERAHQLLATAIDAYRERGMPLLLESAQGLLKVTSRP
ncbi:MAG: AAA family ATPase [Actinomycetota bacterium]